MAGVKGMYQPGNHRKSLEEHELHGTYRSDRHGKKKPKEMDRVHLKMDSFLQGEPMTDEELFDHLAGYLHNNGMTQAVDAIMLTHWLQLMKGMRELQALMDSEGQLAKVGNKLALNLYNDLAKDVRSILTEFHVTPNSRSRAPQVEEVEEKEEDPVDKFLRSVQ